MQATPDPNDRPSAPRRPAGGEPGRRAFEIHRCIGSGGYGEVYLAHMTGAGGVESDVALKVLHEGLSAKGDAASRLRDEARLLGVLNHPAIPAVFDLVTLRGRTALVVEYVHGADLDVCAAAGMPVRAVLEALAVVCDALHAAHTAPLGPGGAPLGLVHRDLKPSNIRIGRHGQVKLLDFGIAKAASLERSARTEDHAVVGSFPYMAPERLRQQEGGTAADVYALGCVLFEALSGTALLGATTVRKQLVLARDPVRHDAEIARLLDAADLPDEVRALVAALVVHDPEVRPTLRELAIRLETEADGRPEANLRRWARGFDWPAPTPRAGRLQGLLSAETMPGSGGQLEDSLTDEASSMLRAVPLPPPPRTSTPARLGAAALVALVALSLLVLRWPLGADEATPGGASAARVGGPAVPVARSDRAPSLEAAAIEAPREKPEITALPEARPDAVEPTPTDAAADPTTPSASRAAPTARIEVDGDAERVWLRDGEERLPPGPVPPGHYRIEAWFPEVGRVDAGWVSVTVGQRILVTCRSGFYRCESARL